MKKTLIFCVLCFLLSSNFLLAQNEKLKTVFIYNFTKYIQWPEESGNDDFVIGVVGRTKLTKELEELAKVKKVGARTLQIKKLEDPGDVSGVNILLISENSSDQLTSIKASFEGEPILIVCEEEGLVKAGAGINFISEDGRLHFEISRSNIEAHSLKVSSQLLSLGKEVL